MNLPAIAQSRGIPPEVWSALKNSLYPGSADESVAMVYDYCKARQLDPMLKPVHLVPMWVKDKENGDKGSMRDVVMPGIGLYRIQADRAGNYAGMSAPVFGPMITEKVGGVDISYPEWCELTVSKMVNDRLVTFTATEYWIENYATAGKDSKAPNTMWLKRPRAQLVKCTEAQALRKAWPELGAQPTAEEMEGKEIEVNPSPKAAPQPKEIDLYSDESFKTNFPAWEKLIIEGKKTADSIINMVSSKAKLSESQISAIRAVPVTIQGN